MFGFFRKDKIPNVNFDPTTQRVAVKASICTGEKTIGFVDIKTGKYTEIMYVRNDMEIQAFMKKYGVDSVENII